MSDWTTKDISDLTGKVFIVTGSNSGIGYEAALALAEKGMTVVIACRNPEKAQKASKAIKRSVHLQNRSLWN
jgi:NAD(P)-dependent dehydrogenase (short-subunit alcohol dehydrogenase family)